MNATSRVLASIDTVRFSSNDMISRHKVRSINRLFKSNFPHLILIFLLIISVSSSVFILRWIGIWLFYNASRARFQWHENNVLLLLIFPHVVYINWVSATTLHNHWGVNFIDFYPILLLDRGIVLLCTLSDKILHNQITYMMPWQTYY